MARRPVYRITEGRHFSSLFPRLLPVPLGERKPFRKASVAFPGPRNKIHIRIGQMRARRLRFVPARLTDWLNFRSIWKRGITPGGENATPLPECLARSGDFTHELYGPYIAAAGGASALVVSEATAQGASVQVRVYDRDHRDYHNWDDHEDRAYRSYLAAQHRSYREYHRQHHRVQRHYWNWRHSHPDRD
jgi:hypothetical protein